jgi:hypothetical protein
MHRSKFAGFVASPVLSFLLIAAAAHAQSTKQTTSNPIEAADSCQPEPGVASPCLLPADQATDIAALEAPAYSSSNPQETPAATQDTTQNPPPAPTEEQRAELARQAQARVRARRQQRIAAIVQDTYSHKYEIFGGSGFLRLRPGPYLQNVSVFGFDAGVTRYLNNKLGITADGRGYFGNAYVGDLNSGLNFFEPSVSSYSISAGPQYRVYMRQKWSVSALGMAGVARDVFYGNSQGLPGTLLGFYPNEWRLTATVGAPIDYNLGPGLSVRVTPNYYLTNWGGQIQNSRGFTGGINYRFGRR